MLQQEDGVLRHVLLAGLVARQVGVEAAQHAAGDAVADGDDPAFRLRRQAGQPGADAGGHHLIALAVGGRIEGPAGLAEGVRVLGLDLGAQAPVDRSPSSSP